jgi:hypothetical protein
MLRKSKSKSKIKNGARNFRLTFNKVSNKLQVYDCIDEEEEERLLRRLQLANNDAASPSEEEGWLDLLATAGYSPYVYYLRHHEIIYRPADHNLRGFLCLSQHLEPPMLSLPMGIY